MSIHRLHTTLIVCACMGWACSGEPDPGQADAGEYVAPTLGERGLPTQGGPEDAGDQPTFDGGDPDLEFDASSPAPDGFEGCCTLTFAIADDNAQEDELYIQLMGSDSPLSGGPTLAYADGIWSVEACVPPAYVGTYSYIIGREVDGEVEETATYNPHAPSDDGLRNLWLTADSCDGASLDLHARTSDR